jgi:hypothetical protein
MNTHDTLMQRAREAISDEPRQVFPEESQRESSVDLDDVYTDR